MSVTDVEGDNVLLGEDGTVYFIDPIIRFKKPLREILAALGFYYFTSITVSKDGREVVVSSQEKSRNKILRLLQEGSVIWRTPKDATTSSAERQGLDYEQPNEAETATKGSGITPQSTSSEGKDTTNSPATNELGEKNGRKARHPSIDEDGLLFRDGDVFYSNAEEAVRGIKQENATPEQWLKMIKNNGGLKNSEDKWLGLSDWLNATDKKTLTKDVVLDYIHQNKVQIEEVEYGEAPQEFEELKSEYERLLREEGFDAAQTVMADRFGDDFNIAFSDIGGELVIDDEDAAGALLNSGNIINSTRKEYTTGGLDNNREIALVVPTIESWNEEDEIHFGDAGNGRAVAWIRFGETTDSDGKRVLVLDEIQSKRHQEGRKKGYRDADTGKKLDAAVNAYRTVTQEYDTYHKQLKEKYDYNSIAGSLSSRAKQFNNLLSENERVKLDELRNKQRGAADALDNARAANKAIPAAPFEKNWHELAMKRMLRYAAENGFDKVAWLTGAQQAERYDMSRQIESIIVEDNTVEEFSDGTPIAKNFTLRATNGMHIGIDVDADSVVHGGEYGGKSISEIVGKELAEKMMLPGSFILEGDGLKIGGEGMKGFYDKILPNFMNKYGKKWGVNVSETTMPDLQEGYQTMHSIDVTDAMRESVMDGQLLFRDGKKIEDVNDRFNVELQQQIDGTLPKGHIYHLGMPSEVLLATGIANAPIQLNSQRLLDKSSNFGHDYELSEIKDLVKAINNPIAIFTYGDKSKAQNIVVEIQHEGKNFIVGLSIHPSVGSQVLDINSIRNVFPKDNAEWLNWIAQGKALFLNKEKIQTLIAQQRTNLADVEYLDLDSITNIIENFENPVIEDDFSVHNDAIKNRIEALFNQAISGEFKGKPISIGRLTDAGKAYLEQISGVSFRENVDFVLNPSDLVHIYKGHFGNNEKDKGQNVPLDIEDIRSLVDVISNPDKVIFFKEGKGLNRNMFYFFKEAEDGTYNLMEIYSDKKGNLTAKTF